MRNASRRDSNELASASRPCRRYASTNQKLQGMNTPSPAGADNLNEFQFRPYLTQRHAEVVALDGRMLGMTAWDVKEAEMRKLGGKMMTLFARTAGNALAGAPCR